MPATSTDTSDTGANAGQASAVLSRSDKDGVATLTLNRPDQFNALSEALLDALQLELNRCDADDSVRVIVIAATGRAFCAGHDLKQMRATHEEGYYQQLFARCGAMMQTITRVQQPVIASVQGIATAAGCQLVATCDLAVAAEDTQFAVSGINLGLFCSTPSVALARNISRKRAFEMLITGDFIDARQALDWGLVNRVVAASDLNATVDALCQQICSKPAIAVQTGKKLFYQQIERNLADAYQLAGDTMACNMMDSDTVEGIDAFLQKRKPSWSSS